MATTASKGPRYKFGPFELDTEEGRLYRKGTRVKLQDLPYRLLSVLVERSGDVVTRDELQRLLWPANTYVEFDNSLGVAIRKVRDALGDVADAPRYVETIPKRGYRFLGPVTLVSLASRPPQPTLIAFPNSVSAADSDTKPALLPKAGNWWTGILAGSLIILAIAGLWFWKHESTSGSRIVSVTSPVHMRRSIALLGFRNLRGRTEDAWLSSAFAEMLSTELAAGGELRLVPGEDVYRARNELPLSEEDTLSKTTLQRLRTDPGADLVVVGAYTPITSGGSQRIRLDLRVQDTATGETAAEDSVVGGEDDLFQMVSDAGFRLRSALGMKPLSGANAVEVRFSLPANRKALQLFTEGQERLWAFDFARARDLLTAAVAADPRYPHSHAALSEAWSHLGFTKKAQDEVQKARDLSTELPEEERLMVEGQVFSAASEWAQAVYAYRALFTRFPDNLDYGLRLATAQRHLSIADALATINRLRELPPPSGNDARIDMEEASALATQDLLKAQAAAERAIVKGTAEGQHLLVARANGILCQLSASNATSPQAAHAACEFARQSYEAAGDRNNEARVLSDSAGIYYQEGDLARAEAMWREAAKEFRVVGDLEGLAATSNNLGDVFLLEGNLQDAKRFLNQALPNYEAIDDKDGIARILNDLGDLEREQGNLNDALASYGRAKAVADQINDRDVQAYVLTGLAEVAVDQGNMARARENFRSVLSLRNALGEKAQIAEAELAVARIDLDEGRYAEAEAGLSRCRDLFQSDDQSDDHLAASTYLIEALLAQHKSDKAKAEFQAAKALDAKSRNLDARLRFSLASAKLSRELGDLEHARAEQAATLHDAQSHQLFELTLESRLEEAALSRSAGRTGVATAQAVQVEDLAKRKGYLFIASRAADLAR